jgi:hypothetical protein
MAGADDRVARVGGAGTAPGEDRSEVTDDVTGEVTGDVPFAASAPSSSTSTPKRSFRPKQADAFSPSFVRERGGLPVEKSLFDPSP